MKSSYLCSLTTIAGLTLAGTNAHAAVLAVDFQNGSNTAADFEGQGTGTGGPYTTIYGDMSVAVTGAQGPFDRGTPNGANQIDDFYRDFVFDNNSNGFTITISGAGIAANTDYELIFYAYDSSENRNTAVAAADGTVGTKLTGFASGTAAPTTLDQYADSGIFTSNGSGVLTFFVDGSRSGGSGRSSINGFQIVPEPSSTALLGLGGLALLLRRRK